MKKLLLTSIIALLFAGQVANAQSKEFVKDTPTLDAVFAAQTTA